jgi:hypothetical protein
MSSRAVQSRRRSGFADWGQLNGRQYSVINNKLTRMDVAEKWHPFENGSFSFNACLIRIGQSFRILQSVILTFEEVLV